MRVRAMTTAGDMTFGRGSANFLVNSPEAVAQIIGTRLRLWVNEWFLDLEDGTPWLQQVIGKGTRDLYDTVIRQRVLETPGVTSIESYSSEYDGTLRTLTVAMRVNTQYGPTANFNVPVSTPLGFSG